MQIFTKVEVGVLYETNVYLLFADEFSVEGIAEIAVKLGAEVLDLTLT